MLILLDRDGVLNEEGPDGFVTTPDELKLLPGVGAAIARLNARGWPVAVCTNQSCIGRGMIDEARLQLIHDHLRSRLAAQDGSGAKLDAICFAPDPPWAPTDRRKPGPGMLREAMARFRHAPENTIFIGDSITDMQAAKTAGCRRLLVRTGKGRAELAKGLPPALLPVTVVEDLSQAVDRLLAAAKQESVTD
jgi:D-glycero-D-manno-heptose 1,7-bisphosphate phosphatase